MERASTQDGHRPYGTPEYFLAGFPTPKSGANKHCAYGAGGAECPFRRVGLTPRITLDSPESHFVIACSRCFGGLRRISALFESCHVSAQRSAPSERDRRSDRNWTCLRCSGRRQVQGLTGDCYRPLLLAQGGPVRSWRELDDLVIRPGHSRRISHRNLRLSSRSPGFATPSAFDRPVRSCDKDIAVGIRTDITMPWPEAAR